nr:regulatory protein GemA [Vibrio vulnificus]
MVKLSCGHFCIACPRPLTRRYVLLRKIRNLWIKMLKFGVSSTKKHYLVHIQKVLSLQFVSMNQISK